MVAEWSYLNDDLVSLIYVVYEWSLILLFFIFQKAPQRLKNIRLDDTILEEGLQPPAVKVGFKSDSRIVLRQQFPETWIWANLTTG